MLYIEQDDFEATEEILHQVQTEQYDEQVDIQDFEMDDRAEMVDMQHEQLDEHEEEDEMVSVEGMVVLEDEHEDLIMALDDEDEMEKLVLLHLSSLLLVLLILQEQ